ncbi:hypothetical protein L596_009577 [Steinernema carpocapsae]|uniref:Uncharacterized protein n=1 Tax=Steinernema carpocapsae TaxID=34508 RepID=A0A4U5PFS5_STECR|nr:hypothetical protein L596_009577 [Steinernema carpocapsae]
MPFGTTSDCKMPVGLVIMFGIKYAQFMTAVAALMYIFVLPAEVVLEKFVRAGNDSNIPSEFFPDSGAVQHYSVAVLPWKERFCPMGTCWTAASLLPPAFFSLIGSLVIIAMASKLINADRIWNEKRYRSYIISNLLVWAIALMGMWYLKEGIEINIATYDNGFYATGFIVATCLVEAVASFLFETSAEYEPAPSGLASSYAYAEEVANWIEDHEREQRRQQEAQESPQEPTVI